MFDDTPLLMIEDDKSLRALVERLSEATVIGVDTESDSMYHYQEKVCLLQLSDAHGDVIVDPLKVKDLSPLADLFADPTVVKIFHGADYDIVCLKRDFGFETRNLFDTLFAAQFLGLSGLGLADLIGRYFGIPIDKKFQRHDWSRRPLLPEHLDYARGDTHWLLALREILTRQLARVGRVSHHIEECSLIEEREWQGRTFDPDGWRRIKGLNGIDDDGKRIIRHLFRYRDGQARSLDRPPYKVIGDKILLKIAQQKPSTPNALERVLPKMHALKRRHSSALLAAVNEGPSAPEPLPVAEAPAKRTKEPAGVRLRGRAVERVVGALKDWRNNLVRSSGYTPFSVASNSTLKNIARYFPTTADELADVPEVRAWQVVDHGEAMLEVLGEFNNLLEEASPSSGRRRKRRPRSS